ncbi:MAG TPA: UPF0182 family protein [Coriobacteriia bacterium]|nr:UPF0182 family protein [Coriobacteriia bacterium]
MVTATTAEQPGRRRSLTIALFALLLFGFPLLVWAATVYTDYLWFVDVGQRQVFITSWLNRIATGALFGVAAFVLLYANARIARALAPRFVLTSGPDVAPDPFDEIVRGLRTGVGAALGRITFWIPAGLALLLGLVMAANWELMRLALAAVPFGVTDPQFGRDVGFFVFSLPALRVIADWTFAVLVLTTVFTAAVHLLGGAIQPWARLRGFAPHVKAHLSVLMGLVVASKAFDYYVSIYELNLSPRGQVTGASYTDVHAQLPALQLLIIVALASAAILVVNIWFRGWRLPIVAVGVWLATSLLAGSVYPALVQQFRVAPNEVSAEEPFIERNIAATRVAFDIDDVVTRPFPAAENLTAEDVLANETTFDNVRLWDPAVAVQTYRQLQIIRTYYDFKDVDIDRYVVDGRQRQVLVSAREMDTSQLAEQAQTWANKHLVYTHGYGLVISPSNEFDARGLPRFWASDIPPQSVEGLEFTQPAIYFGEATDDYIIVNTGIAEFDFPVGDGRRETFYEGEAGVPVGGLSRRAAFALRFEAPQILFSDYVKADSRVIFDRDIVTRVNKLAPWLTLDGDPYPALVDGRIVWIIDAYTTSRHYPYAQHFRGINYIRNSVKVTVDAYDGTTTLWGFDPHDPVLQAWRSVFPGLVTDEREIPDPVREHFRYPQDLFSLQAEVYKTYHMTDARDFYNKEDAWELPGEREGRPMAPYYLLMRLPGETEESFQLVQPFTPRNRDNMIGWMSVDSDPENYGTRIVYKFPRGSVLLGPEQVSARINQDDVIAPQLTLWSQRGSSVIFGNMLVLPLEDSIVYVQPLFLQAEQTAIPELARVIVAYADKVEMAPDLESALLAVFGERPPADTGSPPAPGAPDTPADAARAQRLYTDALEAQRAGDWAEYGRLIEELGRVLDELAGPAPEDSAAEDSPAP